MVERWRGYTGAVFLDPDERGFSAIADEWLDGLYVRPAFWGTGVAAELHDRAVAALRDAGVGTARLWVLEANDRARRFYERRGWRPDGSTRVVPFPPHPLDVGYSLELDLDPSGLTFRAAAAAVIRPPWRSPGARAGRPCSWRSAPTRRSRSSRAAPGF